MKIEIYKNKLDGDWWFDLGISCQKTDYNPRYKMVFIIALAFFSISIRWKSR